VDVVDGNGEIRRSFVWVPNEIKLGGASAFLLASSVSKSHPKILTHQTKTLIFIWVLMNPLLPFLSPFFLSLGTNCTTATIFFFFF
jgi:hypothetical protein